MVPSPPPPPPCSISFILCEVCAADEGTSVDACRLAVFMLFSYCFGSILVSFDYYFGALLTHRPRVDVPHHLCLSLNFVLY